ncbi:hypothetical protein HHI36_002743 [Cryptolaemus montrouzieri]|uniref:Uncharacterized protein n=1 Tax=Cryptolaemus montrouzieri TaxID=559131 RepID=A0ABD2PBV1_9CUCU
MNNGTKPSQQNLVDGNKDQNHPISGDNTHEQEQNQNNNLANPKFEWITVENEKVGTRNSKQHSMHCVGAPEDDMKMKKSDVRKVFTVSPEVRNIKDSLDKVYIVANTRPEFKSLYSKLNRNYNLAILTEKGISWKHHKEYPE